MKIILLTNFDNFNQKISCDKYGVITLQLIPNRINETRFKDNYLLKKSKTLFQSKYCTIYKKSKNEYLYKYTNHKPLNNFNYEKLEIVEHKIPYNYDNKIIHSRLYDLKKDIYYNLHSYFKDKYNSFN